MTKLIAAMTLLLMTMIGAAISVYRQVAPVSAFYLANHQVKAQTANETATVPALVGGLDSAIGLVLVVAILLLLAAAFLRHHQIAQEHEAWDAEAKRQRNQRNFRARELRR